MNDTLPSMENATSVIILQFELFLNIFQGVNFPPHGKEFGFNKE